MISLNKVLLIGNLTNNPEIRKISNERSVASFWVATNRVWKNSAKEKQEQTEFHNVVLWWKLAEIAQHYFKKWKKIYLEWRLQTHNWEDQAWVKRYKTEIIWENLIMLWLPKSKTSEITEDLSDDNLVEEEILIEEKEDKKDFKKKTKDTIPF